MRSTEAAGLLGVHKSTIVRWVRRGKLVGRRDPRDSRVLLVDREQVEKLAAQIREVHGEPEE